MDVVESIKGWGIFAVKMFSAGVVLMLGSLYMGQNHMLYHPCPPGMPKTPDDNPHGARSPEEYGLKSLDSFEERFVNTSDGKSIHVWKMYQPDSNEAPTLVYFHGNAGNMGFRLQNAVQMYKKCKINVVMMDYRGFGKSTGEPTEEGIKLDAEAVLRDIQGDARLKGSAVVPFGRSLGGAVSIDMAATFNGEIAAVVVENTFLSISRMLDTLMPAISYKPLKALLLRIGWDSEVAIKGLKQPIMFIAGARDELVPHAHMIQLHDLATASVHLDWFLVKNGSHNDSWVQAGTEYYVRLKAFMDRLRGGSSGGDNVGAEDDCEDDGKPNIALPTMGTDFRVTS